jgi:predicted DNA-binding protein
MTSPVAIRLDRATRQRIARIARNKRKTASQVMREAIETGLQEQERSPMPPFELMAGLIGVVHSGDPQGSTDMGRKFAELLKTRRSRS